MQPELFADLPDTTAATDPAERARLAACLAMLRDQRASGELSIASFNRQAGPFVRRLAGELAFARALEDLAA